MNDHRKDQDKEKDERVDWIIFCDLEKKIEQKIKKCILKASSLESQKWSQFKLIDLMTYKNWAKGRQFDYPPLTETTSPSLPLSPSLSLSLSLDQLE